MGSFPRPAAEHGETKMKSKKIFLFSLPLLCALLAGCRTQDEKLAAFFNADTFRDGRHTPAQLMTDRINDPETDTLLKDLLSENKIKKAAARRELQQLKELIVFGKSWEFPAFQIALPHVIKLPVIDGHIGLEEWQKKIETTGSCRAGRLRRSHDGSRMLLSFDKNNLYIAVYVPLLHDGKQQQLSSDDHLLLYFDTPGSSGNSYKECIVTPANGKLATANWVYCGNGKREQLAQDEEMTIRAAAVPTKYGYSVEIAVPRNLLKVHYNGCSRINLLYWDCALRDYRTPIALPYHGHDPFNRINIRLD